MSANRVAPQNGAITLRYLTLVSRQYCHLCDDLLRELRPLAKELGWALRVVDVDSDPALISRWDWLVPVVIAEDLALCHYHLDEQAIRAYCSVFPLESRF